MGRTCVGMLAAVLVLAVTGCYSGHHAASRSKQAHKQSAVPVVYATAVTSLDGKRIAVVTHNRTAIEVGPASGGHRRTIYRSAPDGITTDVYWASPYLIAFGDANFEVNTIDVRTRRVLQIATATSFTISSDGRWIAWSRTDGPNTRDTVGVVRSTGGMCLIPATPANRSDTGAFFKPGVNRLFFLRGPFSAEGGATGASGIISVPMSSLRREPDACG